MDEDIVYKISIENSDVVCILNQEVKMDTGDLYMTFKLLKRRYRSSEESEKLRKLDKLKLFSKNSSNCGELSLNLNY